MVARFITGIGTGIETSTVPMYQSELCEANKRGRLVASEPLFVGVGIEIAYWFDYGMSYTSGSIAWRLPIACQIIFAIARSPRKISLTPLIPNAGGHHHGFRPP
jgi:MFS family permease